MTLGGLVFALAWQAHSAPHSDSATAALVARARERHRQLDAAVQAYRATIRTRIDVSVGRGSFARVIPLAAVEQESELAWQAPNDVRVVTLGQRTRTALPNADIQANWTKPWFIPRFLGDSIRLLDEDFPNRAAIHPLAAGAEAYYRYSIEDSVELSLPGRTVRAIGVRVVPIRSDAALIAGEIWLDRETAETVRLTFAFVGRRLWADPEGDTQRDTARAERANAVAMRVLRVTADLEYGLFEERYWLPFRQSLTLSVELPWFRNLRVPVHFITTFRDVRVNDAAPIVFTVPLPDSGRAERREPLDTAERRRLRAERREGRGRDAAENGRREGYANAGRWPGGRYEVIVPPDSTLRSYAMWVDSLEMDLTPGDAERIEGMRRDLMETLERLPDGLTGRRRLVFAVDRLTDIFRYNRAEGASIGAGYEWRLGPPFLSLMARARYAFTDRRLQAWVAGRRDAPGSRSQLSVFREVRDGDPMSGGLTFGNSFSALWLAHDDGSYVFVEGGELRHQRPWRHHADLTFGLRAARESAPRRLARSAVNDFLGGSGLFQPNAPILGGTFVTANLEADGGIPPLSWRAGIEATSGTGTAARAWLGATARRTLPMGLDLTVSGWVGAGAGDSIPQRWFRLGGTRSLRGRAAGALMGASAWSLGLDLGVPVPRRRLSSAALSPVIFVDAGQVAVRGLAFRGDPSTSVGVGVSALRGALRLQAARPMGHGSRWRVDLVIGARR